MNIPSKLQLVRRKRSALWVRMILVLSVLAAGVAPSLRPAQANGGLPSAFLDQNSVGWASVRNYTSSAFHSYFLDMKSNGYMVVDLEVDEIDGQQRVGAIFQKNTDNRGWASWRNLTSSEFSAKWQNYKSLGYRLIDQESYTLSGQRYYAGVWLQNKEGLSWASWRNLTSSEFSEKFKQYDANGYMPVDFEAYPMGGSVRYAVIWVKNTEGLDWKLWRDQTSAEFSAKFDQYDDAYRMTDVESYIKNGEQQYAGIWVENKNGRGWYEYRDLTPKQFGDKWLQLRDAGYRLVDYEVYPIAGGYRYAGIWRQNSERPNWQLKEQVDGLLAAQALANGIPGMSVAIAKDNQFVYLRGFGYADIDDERIATSRTVYQLASVSKAIGGVLAMRLVEAGQLDLGEQTRSYVPALPDLHTHTVRQTLSNRAGIGHYGDHATPPLIDYPTATSAAMTFWNDPLLYTPGTDYKYSTFGYTLAGAAMEGATGQPIQDLVEDDVSDPFGLSSLDATDWDDSDPDRAALYDGDTDEIVPQSSKWKVLGGGTEASAYDLGRMGIKLVNGLLLSNTSLTTMWTPPDALKNYALGWDTGSEDGTQVVAKNGAWDGSSTYIRIYPAKKIVIVVLINRRFDDPHLATQIGQQLGALMLDAERSAALQASAPILPIIPVQPIQPPSQLQIMDELALDGLQLLVGDDQTEQGIVTNLGDEVTVQMEPSLISLIDVMPEDVGSEAEEPASTHSIFLPAVTK